jgi:hypothetical protein
MSYSLFTFILNNILFFLLYIYKTTTTMSQRTIQSDTLTEPIPQLIKTKYVYCSSANRASGDIN